MYQYAANPDFRIPNAVFLHTELPIRIAQRAVDLLTLPFGLSEATPIRQVACTYIQYLHTILTTPVPQSTAQEEYFTSVLQSMVLDRSSIPHAIAQGLAIWQSQEGATGGPAQDPERYHEMEEALYRFFTARVGLRFLTEHHVLSSPSLKVNSKAQASSSSQSTTASSLAADDLRQVTSMFGQDAHDQADTVGCIQAHVDLAKEVRRVADLVRQEFAAQGHAKVPVIEIVDCQKLRSGSGNGDNNNNTDDDFTYVPHHLHYMMLELLKNSVRATIRHAERTGTAMEPIRVVMVKGDEDVTIKVADKAGGIPRSRMAQIWKFAHSTDARNDDDNADANNNNNNQGGNGSYYESRKDATSGTQFRGFGLPITRIYARYFGGELTLKSMEGYGLDAYLHLPRLGKMGENLPPRVRSSPGELDSLPMSSSSSSSSGNTSYGRFWTIGSGGNSGNNYNFNSRHFTSLATANLEDEIRHSFMSLMNKGGSSCAKR